MSNKDIFKKLYSKKINDKDKNYDKILESIERDTKNKKYFKWSLAPICLLVIFGGFLFMNFNNKDKVFSNNRNTENDSNIKLNINDIKEEMALGAPRYDAVAKEIQRNGVNIVWPEVLKDGIEIPDDLDKHNAYALYTRKDKTSEYDILNCYVYNYSNIGDLVDDLDYKNIRLSFSKTNKPIRDYFFSLECSKDTIINNIKLKIYRYDKIYFVEFKYKGYNFDIETNNITEKELENLLTSIIK